MSKKEKIIVGVSGGVDSSVSAFLLKKQGFNVTGIYMKNWDIKFEKNNLNTCSQDDDMEDARLVCSELDIPFYVVNFSRYYKDNVFDCVVERMKDGETPNPDILCNKLVKFDKFLNKSISLGANKIATGHYARIVYRKGQAFLAKAIDNSKDQSYFLHSIDRDVLCKIMFPLGEIEKKEVREIAKQKNIHVHNKKDSVGICFIGKRKFSDFITGYIEKSPGIIVDESNNKKGEHEGLHLYTIGQRKGIVGGLESPYYVLDKDYKNNTLIITYKKELLISTFCMVKDFNMLADSSYFEEKNLTCKVRYRTKDVKCKFNLDSLEVNFLEEVSAVTAGQSIVFYSGDLCLGGGVIHSVR